MKCPSCEKGNVEKKKVTHSQIVKGEALDVVSDSFSCPKCGFVYLDDQMMDNLAILSANTYRRQHRLLTSDEIVGFRNKLGMSQVEFAKFLSVGVASVKRWEGAGIQDHAMDELIRLKCDVNSQANAMAEVVKREVPNVLTGHKKLSIEKIRQLVLFFAPLCKSQMFIYKALFYSDFFHFKEFQIGITGSRYRALQYGPVPFGGDSVFREMEKDGALSKSAKSGHDYSINSTFDPKLFSDDELQTLERVKKFITKVGYKNLVDISHEEDGWKTADRSETISYESAMKLKAKV